MNQVTVGGEIWKTSDKPLSLRPKEFAPLPVSFTGVKPSQAEYYVDGVAGGNAELGFVSNGIYTAPSIARDVEITVRIPSDPTQPSLRVELMVPATIRPRCAPRQALSFSRTGIPFTLRDDLGRATLGGTALKSSDGPGEISIEVDAVSPVPVVPSTQPTLAHVRIATNSNASYENGSVTMRFPFSGSLQGWYRSGGAGAFTSLGDFAPVDGAVSFMLPPESDFGDLVITFPETHSIVLSRSYSGVSGLEVPDELNVSTFGPIDSSGDPVFPNLIKEGTAFPLLIKGDLPETIEGFEVTNARVYSMQPGGGSWNLSSPTLFSLVEPIITFGTFRAGSPVISGDRQFGITLKSEALESLAYGDILEVDIEAVSGGQAFPLPTGQLAFLGLPEIRVQPGDSYDAPFSGLTDVFTVDGKRIDGFIDLDGCPDPGLWESSCSTFQGDPTAIGTCDFEKTGCYSEIHVAAGATLGVGRPVTSIEPPTGPPAQPVDHLAEFEAEVGSQLKWPTAAQRSANNVGIFATLASSVRLWVTGDVKVYGELYAKGMNGLSSSSDVMVGPATRSALRGGLVHWLDPSKPAYFFGGTGAAGADKNGATPTSAPSGQSVDLSQLGFQPYRVIINPVHTEFRISGGGVATGGVGVTRQITQTSVFDLFNDVKKVVSLVNPKGALVEAFKAGGPAAIKGTFVQAFNGYAQPDENGEDQSLKLIGEMFKTFDNVAQGKWPPDAKTAKAAAEALKFFGADVKVNGAAPYLAANFKMFDDFQLSSSSSIQASGAMFDNGDPDSLQFGGPLAGMGGFTEDLNPAELGFQAVLPTTAGRGGGGGAGGGASAIAKSYGSFPFVGTLSTLDKFDGGGGAGGGAPGGVVAIFAGGTAFINRLDATGGNGGFGHPSPQGAGVGGGGAGGEGGRVFIQAREISAQAPLDVSGGLGGKGLSVHAGTPVTPTFVFPQVQVFHGFLNGGMVMYDLGASEMRFTFPDGRPWHAITSDALDPAVAIKKVRGMGEAFSSGISGGILMIDDQTKIVRMGFPDFFTNEIVGERVSLGSAIASAFPGFVPVDIAQDPENDNDIFVSGFDSISPGPDSDTDEVSFKLLKLDSDGLNPVQVFADTFNSGRRVRGLLRFYGLPSNIDFMSDGRLYFRAMRVLAGGSRDWLHFAHDPVNGSTTLLTNSPYNTRPVFSILRPSEDDTTSKLYEIQSTFSSNGLLRTNTFIRTPKLDNGTGVITFSDKSVEITGVWPAEGNGASPGIGFFQGTCFTVDTVAENPYFKNSLESSNIRRIPQIADINGNSNTELDFVIADATTKLRIIGFDSSYDSSSLYVLGQNDGVADLPVKLSDGTNMTPRNVVSPVGESVEIQAPASPGFHKLYTSSGFAQSPGVTEMNGTLVSRHVLVLD